MRPFPPAHRLINVALSTGTGWESQLWTGGPNVGNGLLDYGQCFARDFNGDGKTDLACYEPNGLNNWEVALSTGSGWSLSIQAIGIPHTLAFEVVFLVLSTMTIKLTLLASMPV
jgi:hypothetical protein